MRPGRPRRAAVLFPELAEPQDRWAFERMAREQGHRLVAGLDEAGRGPLAGPVVAAAVVLDPEAAYPGVDDSKKLAPTERERLYWFILGRARAVGVGLADWAEIDRLNILRASLLAMSRAVDGLKWVSASQRQTPPRPDYLLVDGPHPTPLNVAQRAVPHGDARSFSIAAASIVAKVTRDRLLIAFDRQYPGYGFADHKGYPTANHLEALTRLGPSPIHRLTYKPVAAILMS